MFKINYLNLGKLFHIWNVNYNQVFTYMKEDLGNKNPLPYRMKIINLQNLFSGYIPQN